MKTKSKIVFQLVIMIITFPGGVLNGQTINRVIETLEEGEILILSSTDRDIVRYQALTYADVSLEGCLNVMKQTANHTKIIRGASKTEMVNRISKDEWYNYYILNGRMGMPDYDVVMKMRCLRNENQRSFAILGEASPSMVENKGIDRIESYKIMCFVRELAFNKVVISIFAEYKPIYPAAEWKIKMWYPEPANLLEGIVCLAAGYENRINMSNKYKN